MHPSEPYAHDAVGLTYETNFNYNEKEFPEAGFGLLDPKKIKLIDPQKKALTELQADEWHYHPAVAPNIGHSPGDRGRAEGTTWWDYGNRFSGHIMYGPYLESLPPGAYAYGFDVEFEMPPPGAYDYHLFLSDAAKDVGHYIDGSAGYAGYLDLWKSEYNRRGTYQAIMYWKFAVTDTIRQVEFRLKNQYNPEIKSGSTVIRPAYHGSYKIIVHNVVWKRL